MILSAVVGDSYYFGFIVTNDCLMRQMIIDYDR